MVSLCEGLLCVGEEVVEGLSDVANAGPAVEQAFVRLLGQDRIKRVKQACLFGFDNPLHYFSKSLAYTRLHYIRAALPVDPKNDLTPIITTAYIALATTSTFDTGIKLL